MTSESITVVGSGPNGLSAAVALARAGREVTVLERAPVIGGGTRTEELTLPGFLHDVCSAVHPTGVASPFFEEISLDVPWIQPEIPLTHPLDDGDVVALFRNVGATANQFGAEAGRYLRLVNGLVRSRREVIEGVLGPMQLIPRHPGSFAKFASIGALPASVVASRLGNRKARALLAGLSAHAIAPLTSPGTAGVGLFLGLLGHTHGWPITEGGSAAIARALEADLLAHGGRIEVGREVRDAGDLDDGPVVLDLMPPAVARIAGERLDSAAHRRLARWRPGPGVFKVDWALDGPIPWSDPLSPSTATVHVGGTFDEIADAERRVVEGEHPDRPFVLLAQPTVIDPSRAPEGKHIAWAYCHVPNGSTMDMTEAIERQVERFAPGFQERILAQSTIDTRAYEDHNPNYVGGDIGGGRFALDKVLQFGATRPFDLGGGVYLASSAVPPGGGVHGMCGALAAEAVTRSG
jgi:phytoene dehydrogenase-like protein